MARTSLAVSATKSRAAQPLARATRPEGRGTRKLSYPFRREAIAPRLSVVNEKEKCRVAREAGAGQRSNLPRGTVAFRAT